MGVLMLFSQIFLAPLPHKNWGDNVGKVVITLNVPDGMEEFVKSLIEREAKLIVRKISTKDFKDTFGILQGKKKSVNEIEADIYDEWEV
ncbi:protein of unknown function [Thermococcus nautili]|nr:protein of unknown function [Thermococcus nautili]